MICPTCDAEMYPISELNEHARMIRKCGIEACGARIPDAPPHVANVSPVQAAPIPRTPAALSVPAVARPPSFASGALPSLGDYAALRLTQVEGDLAVLREALARLVALEREQAQLRAILGLPPAETSLDASATTH